MTPFGESFGPIGKQPSKIVGGKRLQDIDPAETKGYKPPQKPSGKGLKAHLALISDELSSHVKMRTLERNGFRTDLFSEIHPDINKELPAKILLAWLAEHKEKTRDDAGLSPMTLDAAYARAKERGFLMAEEDHYRGTTFWKESTFWKKFIKPLIHNGWLNHDERTGVIRLKEDQIARK